MGINMDNKQSMQMSARKKYIILSVAALAVIAIVAVIVYFAFVNSNSNNSTEQNSPNTANTIALTSTADGNQNNTSVSENTQATITSSTTISDDDKNVSDDYVDNAMKFSISMNKDLRSRIAFVEKSSTTVEVIENTNLKANYGGILFTIVIVDTGTKPENKNYKVMATKNGKDYIVVYPDTAQYDPNNEISSENYNSALKDLNKALETFKTI